MIVLGANKSVRSARFDTRRITFLALMLCAALVLSLIENMLPPLIPIAPAAKLGLGNIAPLLALVLLGVPDAYIVAALKCLLTATLSGGLSGLMYSVPSCMIALSVEVILYKTVFDRMSLSMISLIGALAFNAVQLAVAGLVTGVNLITLLPFMLLAGVFAGAFTGLTTYLIVKKLPYSVYGTKG